ncbi:hypothetical protein BDV96DRAFT_668375 [Lophiotrema nucula]|uniref:Uncharacterized protein n=1 Tax=Lophiotrema nucula TaxID=690887 RepID=A0A6A5ZRZ2_9PLEO|nr:hypothetical protein BDV96DRAFT_668375 [Lophiotrema nucula]
MASRVDMLNDAASAQIGQLYNTLTAMLGEVPQFGPDLKGNRSELEQVVVEKQQLKWDLVVERTKITEILEKWTPTFLADRFDDGREYVMKQLVKEIIGQKDALVQGYAHHRELAAEIRGLLTGYGNMCETSDRDAKRVRMEIKESLNILIQTYMKAHHVTKAEDMAPHEEDEEVATLSQEILAVQDLLAKSHENFPEFDARGDDDSVLTLSFAWVGRLGDHIKKLHQNVREIVERAGLDIEGNSRRSKRPRV